MTQTQMPKDRMLRVRVTYGENSVSIALKGEVDMSTAPELLESVQLAFARNPTSIVLDVGELAYIDSVGLGVLVTVYKRAQVAATEFVLSAPTGRMLRLLEITGLKDVFAVGESV